MPHDLLIDDVLQTVRRICKPGERLDPDADTPLADTLGLSSVQLIMLLTQLCDRQGVDLMALSDADLRAMKTPRDIAAALQRARNARLPTAK